MNETVNKILLVGDKFMREMQLKQPGFPYSDCGPFSKKKERVDKFMQTGSTDFIYKKLIKPVFNMIWLMANQKIQQKDKVIRDKAFKIKNDPKYDGYQRGLASMVYKSFDKSSGSGIANEPNDKLANELRKPIILHHLEEIFGVLIQLICNC